MTEHSYVECTASASPRWPSSGGPIRDRSTPRSAARSTRGVASCAAPSGRTAPTPASGAINFTYGAFHAVAGAARGRRRRPTIQRSSAPPTGSSATSARTAAGASTTRSCLRERYVEHAASQAVMTAWALLALLDSRRPGRAGRARRGLARRPPAGRRLLAAGGRQRRLLRHGDARLPALPELLPRLGARAPRRAHGVSPRLAGGRRGLRRHAPRQSRGADAPEDPEGGATEAEGDPPSRRERGARPPAPRRRTSSVMA